MRTVTRKSAYSLLVLTLVLSGVLGAGARIEPHVTIVGSESLLVPAVTLLPNGSFAGVTSYLRVEALYPGSGRVYFSTEPLTEIDTQAAARIAALIASVYAGVDPLSYDWLVSLKANTSLVGGPSASAATALAMYAILTGRHLPPNVSLTGMINVDGSIGPVGGIPEKLAAAAKAGVRLFFIPRGEEVTYVVKRVVKHEGPFIITQEVRVPVNVTELGARLGVRVVPVASFAELIEHVFGVKLPPVKLRPPSALSEYLEDVAKRYYREAYSNLTATSTPRNLPSEVAEYLSSLKSRVEALLNEASEALNAGRFYVAASNAFEAAIYAFALHEYVRAIKEHVEKGVDINKALRERVKSLIATVRQLIEVVEDKLERITGIQDVNALQVATAVYERLHAAKLTLKAVEGELSSNPLAALEDSVYAYYRIRSCLDWLNVYHRLGAGVRYDRERLLKTTMMFTSFAETLVTYLEKLGVANSYLTVAKQVIDEIKGSGRLPLPFQLQLSINAIVYASLALHAEYGTAKLLYNASRETAVMLYQRVRANGVEPILAASYIEAGDAAKDPMDKLAMYTRASAILLALYTLTYRHTGVQRETSLTESSVTKAVTTTITLTKIERVTRYIIAPQSRNVIPALAVGILLGIAIGSIATLASQSRRL